MGVQMALQIVEEEEAHKADELGDPAEGLDHMLKVGSRTSVPAPDIAERAQQTGGIRVAVYRACSLHIVQLDILEAYYYYLGDLQAPCRVRWSVARILWEHSHPCTGFQKPSAVASVSGEEGAIALPRHNQGPLRAAARTALRTPACAW